MNRLRGGFNESKTVYRVYFAADHVYLHDGSICNHEDAFSEMKAGGTFEERVYFGLSRKLMKMIHLCQ